METKHFKSLHHSKWHFSPWDLQMHGMCFPNETHFQILFLCWYFYAFSNFADKIT